jgi:MFS family permease
MVSARDTRLLAHVRALPPAAWALLAGTFVNRFGSFVIAFLVLYMADRGFSAGQAGLALSLYGAGAVCAVLAGGQAADLFGRRNAIAASMFGSAAAMTLLARAESLPAILALAAFAGFAAELYRPASAALVADLTPAGERVTAFALYRLAINAGHAAGPAVAGLLAERSYTLLFLGDAATSVVFGVVALVAFPRTRPAAHEVSPASHVLRRMAGDASFRRFLLACLLAALVVQQAYASLALHVRALGHPTRVYGWMMGLNGLLIILFELGVVSVTRRQPVRAMMALGFLLSGVGIALTGAVTAMWALFATVAVWTLGEMVFSPVAAAHVADLAPADMRARYQSAFALTWTLGMAVAPAMGARVYGANPSVLWIGCAMLGAASAALVLVPDRAPSPAIACD